jgi:GTPase SAR1 family protein
MTDDELDRRFKDAEESGSLNLRGLPITDAELRRVGGLTALTTLDVSWCDQLTDAGLKHLARLPALTTLDLGGCDQLTNAGLQHLARLSNLTKLDLRWCDQLTDAELEHLAGLTALTTLNLHGCTQLTDTGFKHLSGLSALTTLDLSGCKQLTDAGLRQLAGLRALRTLDVGWCEKVSVAQSVADRRDARAIFAALRSGQQLPHLRVAMVGMGEVGKSSLFQPLFMNIPLRRGERPPGRTHDVSMVRPERVVWSPMWRSAAGLVKTRTHVWDFGGQIVLHGIHEEFLRPDGRTVFVLVVAADRPPQHFRDYRGDEAGNRLNYWLRTVGAYAGEAPIVVAITKCDVFTAGQPRAIDQEIHNGKHLAQLTGEDLGASVSFAANVSGIVDGCSAYEDSANSGKPVQAIDNLRRAIEAAVVQLPELGKRLPKSTVELIGIVERAWKTKGSATFAEFRRWCADASKEVGDDPAIDPDTQLDILRSLGVLLYFGTTDAERARWEGARSGKFQLPAGELSRSRRVSSTGSFATVVVNPAWFTWTLYEVLWRTEKSWRFDRTELREMLQAGVDKARQEAPELEPPDDPLPLLEHALRQTGLCFEYQDSQYDRTLWCFPRGRKDIGAPPDWFANPGRDGAAATYRWPLLRESAFHRFGIEQLQLEHVQLHDQIPLVGRYAMRLAPNYRAVEAYVVANFDESAVRVVVHGGDGRARDELLHQVGERLADRTSVAGMQRDDELRSSDSSKSDDAPAMSKRLTGKALEEAMLEMLIDRHKFDADKCRVASLTGLMGKELADRFRISGSTVSGVWKSWSETSAVRDALKLPRLKKGEEGEGQAVYDKACSNSTVLAILLRAICEHVYQTDDTSRFGRLDGSGDHHPDYRSSDSADGDD